MLDRPLWILVADDNEFIRRGICTLLRSRSGWTICGQAIDGRDTVQKALELKPDIILVDVSMPDLNGFEAARTIHADLPTTKILIVTEHDSRTLNGLPPEAGVCDYIPKSRIAAELIPRIEAASKIDSLDDQARLH